MKKWLKFTGIFLAVLFAAIIGLSLTFLIRGGAFLTAELISPGICKIVPTGNGSAEDIDIDRVNGIALLSALDRRGLVENRPVTGTILQIDLSDPTAVPLPALAMELPGFRPHGISLFRQKNGSQVLFIINNPYGVEETIELFQKDKNESLFRHIETLSDPLITHPNDLVAVGERQFYIANDSGATNSIERIGEMVFGVGLSPLVFFDGEKFSIVADDLRSAGGINTNEEKGRLFVGETMGKAIRIYELNDNKSISQYIDTIELEASVDNIDFDSSGNIWIANHMNTLALVRHFGDATMPAPSQIQRIFVSRGGYGPIDTILEDSGQDFSAASVGARYEDILVLGSITEPSIKICELGNYSQD